jgi:serine/threonine protein phosphatase 1
VDNWKTGRGGASAINPERVFAIGDVHGRFDLFRQLINQLARQNATRPPANTQMVLLGNIVDHGPDAARMVQGCMRITAANDSLVVLKGNHEDMMAEALSGNLAVYSHWLDLGGRETLLSWGVDASVASGLATIENLSAAAQTVGDDVIEWLTNLPLHHRYGPYLFVHAGIRPGIALDDQEPDDLMWIQDDFLNSQVPHGFIIVHGHSATEDGPVFRLNRIGIDTGAFKTGRLTALGIDGEETWTLSTADNTTPT